MQESVSETFENHINCDYNWKLWRIQYIEFWNFNEFKSNIFIKIRFKTEKKLGAKYWPNLANERRKIFCENSNNDLYWSTVCEELKFIQISNDDLIFLINYPKWINLERCITPTLLLNQRAASGGFGRVFFGARIFFSYLKPNFVVFFDVSQF
jgi:hypothetical protein